MRPAPPQTVSARRALAFTLVELLVAMAVTVVLATFLVVVSQRVLGFYQTSQNRVAIDRDTSLALEFLISDLEALAPPINPDAETLRTTVESVGGAVRAHWLTLVASAVDRDTGTPPADGSPRAVSYRVVRQDPIQPGGSKPMFALYRAVAPARDTFDEAVGSPDIQAGFWGGGRSTSEIDDFLVGNVVGFEVRFIADDGVTLLTAAAPGESLRVTGSGAVGADGNALPDGIRAISVEITVLNRDGARLLDEGVVTLDEETVRRYGRRFTRQTSVIGPAAL